MQHRLKTTRFAEPFAETYPRPVAELEEQLVEGERLTRIVRERLTGVVRAGN